MTKLLRYYVDGRLFEWSMTAPMLGLSVMTFIWPETLRSSSFQWLVAAMPIPLIEALLFSISWAALIGLLLNGHEWHGIKIGPLIRSAAAVARAVMWAQFVLALFRLSIFQGYPSPGLPFWTMFAITEIYVANRTGKMVAGNGRAS
jgi:hypothetical protein